MTSVKDKAIIHVDEKSEPVSITRADYRTTIISTPDASSAAKEAVKLVDDGVEAIEICGGASTRWLAEIRAAIQEQVPVGLVTYPFESLDSIAEYKARFESDEATEEGTAFVIKTAEADPAVDRINYEHEGGWSVFVTVSDVQEAAEVASGLADEGATLIELYGGFDLTAVGQIQKAAGGKIPVGIATYAGSSSKTKT